MKKIVNNSFVQTEIYKPKSIEEAINHLHQFLECDLYTKFRPIETLKDGSELIREDIIETEKEFCDYLESHFNILREQIKELTQNKKEMLKNLKK